MKQYNLTPQKRQMSFGELSVIVLGEKGRGRCEVIVPFEDGIKETDLVIPATTKTGKIKIAKGGDDKGWIARISCKGGYTRGTFGTLYVHKKDSDKVRVLASGYGAFGDAGRLGSWDDFLLQLDDNVLLKIKESGRSPEFYLYFSKNKVFKIMQEEIEIFLEDKEYEFSKESELFKIINTKH